MIISREEFERQRQEGAERILEDEALNQSALNFLEEAVKKRLVYQTSWLGEPILQLPQDLFALQEIIFVTRPDFVIEVGVAWAGSLLFYQDLLRRTGGKGVIGVDTFIPDDLRERLSGKALETPRIHLVEGSSLSDHVLHEVNSITRSSGRLLIHLDSDHTAAHVEKELAAYGPLLDSGFYMVCGDTHVELLPAGTYQGKPYDAGNNPMVGLTNFLSSSAGAAFQVDSQVGGRYLLSLNPGGYLRRL